MCWNPAVTPQMQPDPPATYNSVPAQTLFTGIEKKCRRDVTVLPTSAASK